MTSPPTPPVAGGPKRHLYDLASAAVRRGPSHPALLEPGTGRTVTWKEFDAAARAGSVRLRESGLRTGDRVVVRLPTSIEFCLAVFAVAGAGGVTVPVGTGSTARELAGFCEHSGARMLMAAVHDPVATDVAERTGTARVDPPDPGAAAPADGAGVEHDGGEAVAVLSYTSGTSGGRRGVMLSHRALLANLEQCAALRPPPITAADRVLLALPLFHSYGLGPGLLQVAYSAATAVLLDRFDAEQALEVVREHRVTTVIGVPPMYRAWLRLPPDRVAEGLGTVRTFTSGAAPLDPSVLAGMRTVTGLDVFEGYGLTETGPVLTTTLVSGTAKPGSVGRPLPGSATVAGVEIRLVDNAGRPLPMPGEDGEDVDDEDAGGTGVVAARGPNLFSGYWPDGAHGPTELPGLGPGWIRTGDVGFLDTEGDLHLVDRAGDLIIVNGFNVYPHEVEDVLAEHPAVVEAAAVGVADDRTGEAVRAVLVTVGDERPTVTEIVEHCAARLARFKVPVEVAFADELPHSPTGKLARHRLRGELDEVIPAWPSGAPMPAARGDEDTAADLF